MSVLSATASQASYAFTRRISPDRNEEQTRSSDPLTQQFADPARPRTLTEQEGTGGGGSLGGVYRPSLGLRCIAVPVRFKRWRGRAGPSRLQFCLSRRYTQYNCLAHNCLISGQSRHKAGFHAVDVVPVLFRVGGGGGGTAYDRFKGAPWCQNVPVSGSFNTNLNTFEIYVLRKFF